MNKIVNIDNALHCHSTVTQYQISLVRLERRRSGEHTNLIQLLYSLEVGNVGVNPSDDSVLVK